MSAFDFLKQTNDWLEKYPVKVIGSFNNFFVAGEDIAQSEVDIICTWLAWRVNITIERVRQELIKALYNMYVCTTQGPVAKVVKAISNFVKNPLKAVGEFASSIFGPVGVAINWIVMLAKELPRLAKNLSDIAQALPPEPVSPTINYDKFKVKIASVTLATITSDPSNLPPPEVMFPEPPRPWSKDAFDQEMLAVTSAKKKYFYPLKEDITGRKINDNEIADATGRNYVGDLDVGNSSDIV